MEDDSSKRGVVIKGPWKKVVEQKIDKEIDVREDLKMIAEMHKVLLHQLIFTLKETGYDIESDEFVKESGFMGEVIRATLMREMGYSNPMSNFINQVVGIDIKDGERYANFNSDNLIKLLDKKDDKKD
jgi:CYTH domain-containing protein